MQVNDFEHFLNKAEELSELEDKILNLSIEFNVDVFLDLIEQFYVGIEEIRDAFIETAVLPVTISEVNEDNVEFLQAILNNESFEKLEQKRVKVALRYFFENATKKKKEESFDDWIIRAFEESDQGVLDKYNRINSYGELNINLIEDLVDEYLYSWFGPYQYIEDLRNAGAVLINSQKTPDNITHVISTIKSCYAFQQHLAVIVLCRTALEIALRDLYLKLGFAKKGSPTNSIAYNYFVERRQNKRKKYANEYDPSPEDLRNLICRLPEYQDFEEDLRELYSKLSRVIHGSADNASGKDRSEKFMKETFWLIHDLYNKS